MTYFMHFESPLGPVLMTSDGTSLTRLWISDPTPQPGWIEATDTPPFPEARAQLAEYFAGERQTFTLPLAPEGTEFQKKVWTELRQIPFGLTTSYGALATRLGNPSGSRAVGLANGKNPIWLIVPCHRVIGANGKLVGYAGGLARKSALLDFEAAVLGSGPQRFL
jgi:methylated-DNA-[protein]-cysteine S-methyltransferase